MVRCPECGEIISPNGAVTASAMLGVHRRLEHPAAASVGTGRNNDRAARKLTPRHLGRLSADERAQIEGRQRIEARDLRSLMTMTGVPDEHLDNAMKAVRWWLMDAENDRRIKDELDEQAVISRLLEMARAEEERK